VFSLLATAFILVLECAIKSVANIVDTKVSAVSAELTAEIVEDINNIDVDVAKIEKAQTTIKALNSIKF
jgi:hypothetical protein